MKKFKVFFYPVYILSASVALYFSIDILLNTDSYIEKVDFSMLRKIPEYMLYGFVFMTLLMFTELLLENYQIIQLKKQLKAAEEETLRVKAKLFDQSESVSDEDIDQESDEEDDE